MDWEKTNQEMADEFERLITGYDCRKKPMFGCPVYFINDNMWAGVKGSRLFLRLSPQDLVSMRAECDEIGAFEPRPGLIMKGYAEVPDSKLSDEDFIHRWISASYDYVKKLPPKVKKPKKAKG